MYRYKLPFIKLWRKAKAWASQEIMRAKITNNMDRKGTK